MLAFELCLRLGELHPDYLLAKLTNEQWEDWLAFNRISPIGDQRQDFLMSRLLAAWTSKASLEELMPDWGQEKEGERIEFLRQLVKRRGDHNQPA